MDGSHLCKQQENVHTWKGPMTNSMTYGDYSFAIHTADFAYLYGYNVFPLLQDFENSGVGHDYRTSLVLQTHTKIGPILMQYFMLQRNKDLS